MTTRYYEETPCEHGEIESHTWFTEKQRLARECPGGQRRELTGVEIDSPGLFFGGAMSVIRGHYVVIPLGDR